MFIRYERTWKARALAVNRNYLRNQLLPHFAGRPIADIEPEGVRSWFASLGATPVAENWYSDGGLRAKTWRRIAKARKLMEGGYAALGAKL